MKKENQSNKKFCYFKKNNNRIDCLRALNLTREVLNFFR